MADAGWYPDAHDPNSQLWFDGQNWTGHRRPNPSAANATGAAGASEDTVRRGDLPAEPAQQQWSQPAAQQWSQPPQQSPQQPTPQQQWGQPAQAPTQQWAQPASQSPTQAWGQPAGSGPAGQGDAAQPPFTPPPAKKGRRRGPLIIAGVAAIAVIAGVVTWLVWPDDPEITYQGKEIAKADTTLTAAEKSVASAVSERHGAKNGDTRCYFAKPKTAKSGDKESDVESSLRCGPVLFVDGERSASYLSVPLTQGGGGSKATLTAATDIGNASPAAIGDVNLVRPDGKTPPSGDGTGDLKVPQPPAAAKDVLTTASLGSSVKPTPVNTTVVGKEIKVTLSQIAKISRYGSGDDARSAPSGQQLVAFKLTTGIGDVGGNGISGPMLKTGSGVSRAIPEAGEDEYVVAAIPTSGAAILISDSGVQQTIALPSGKPGSANLAVLQRKNRTRTLSYSTRVTFTVSKSGRSASVTYPARATRASLDYWAPANTSIHASSPKNALLSVRLNYTDKKEPGRTFGFDPGMLTLRAGGKTYAARNVAPKGKISNVFEVPANFTSGSLVIGGSIRDDGYTLRVKTKRVIPISIAAN